MERKSKTKKGSTSSQSISITVADYIELQNQYNAALKIVAQHEESLHWAQKIIKSQEESIEMLRSTLRLISESNKLQEANKAIINGLSQDPPQIGSRSSLATTKPVAKTCKKKIHLICKVDVDREDFELQFLERYTSSGIVNDCDGDPCYPINELNGDLYFANCFHVCKSVKKSKQ